MGKELPVNSRIRAAFNLIAVRAQSAIESLARHGAPHLWFGGALLGLVVGDARMGCSKRQLRGESRVEVLELPQNAIRHSPRTSRRCLPESYREF